MRRVYGYSESNIMDSNLSIGWGISGDDSYVCQVELEQD